KKDVTKYHRFTKLLVADLIKKFSSIPQRLEEDYYSIKDDIPLVSVYTTGNVTVRGILILDEFLTDDIRAAEEYKEYEKVFVREKILEEDIAKEVDGEEEASYASEFANSIFQDDDDDFSNRIEPRSHKEHPKTVNDDDEREDADMNDLSSDKTISQELKKVHGRVDKVLHDIIPQISFRATDDLIKTNLKITMADTIIQERDAFHAKVPALISKSFADHAPNIIKDLFKNHMKNKVIQVHPTTSASTSTTTSADLQQQLYLKMKSNLQDQAADPALWEVLKRKFEKSSISTTSYRDDAFRP
nr:hypothetical protein [Tanacetum cinerariifolium]